MRPRTETLEEYHVAHGDGSDRDVGTCTWRVTLEGRKIQQTWISEKPSAPSSLCVINKFNWKQINLPTSFNIFQAHELLHPWNQGILSCFFFPLDHDPPDKQPKSTALVWVHLQKLQPNKTNTGTNHFYDLKKIMAHFIFLAYLITSILISSWHISFHHFFCWGLTSFLLFRALRDALIHHVLPLGQFSGADLKQPLGNPRPTHYLLCEPTIGSLVFRGHSISFQGWENSGWFTMVNLPISLALQVRWLEIFFSAKVKKCHQEIIWKTPVAFRDGCLKKRHFVGWLPLSHLLITPGDRRWGLRCLRCLRAECTARISIRGFAQKNQQRVAS